MAKRSAKRQKIVDMHKKDQKKYIYSFLTYPNYGHVKKNRQHATARKDNDKFNGMEKKKHC